MRPHLLLLFLALAFSACASSKPETASESPDFSSLSNEDLRGQAAEANVAAACELSSRLLAMSEPEGVRAEGYVWGRLASERDGCDSFDEQPTRSSLTEQERQGADALYREVSMLWRIMEASPRR